jgi:pyridoxamine 5'-phosphate oxidase
MAGGLSELTVADEPIALFNEWFKNAKQAGIFLPEAITLATATKEGVPSARMMLLKAADSSGFVFYTNFGSRKVAELRENPRAALVVHWPTLQRQVRVEGVVQQLSSEESQAYFATRPRGSQIGAWASQQSTPVTSRAELEQRFREYEQKFSGGEVPLPDFWGGFRLEPSCIEFWQGRLNRLHDRLRYTPEGNSWHVTRLCP